VSYQTDGGGYVSLHIFIRNAGTVPTRGLVIKVDVTSNGDPLFDWIDGRTGLPLPNSALVRQLDVVTMHDITPTEITVLRSTKEFFMDIRDGKRSLDLRMSFTYKGIGNTTYVQCASYHYDAETKKMIVDENEMGPK
jgi:hypothetical protein